MPRTPAPAKERFKNLYAVDPIKGCWNWRTGERGKFWDGSKHVLAYRFSYSIWREPVPDHLIVCHRCDNPCCVNPKHLFIGTNKDNMADAARKGRMSSGPSHTWFQPRGESVYCAKLSVKDVLFIRRVYKPRDRQFSAHALGRRFGVSKTAILYAAHGRNWKTVKRVHRDLG